MAVFLLKFVFFTLSSLMNLISALIFSIIGRLTVLVIQGLSVPTQGINGLLAIIRSMIQWIIQYFAELLKDAISSIISAAFDSFKEAITGSVDLTSSAVGEIMEKTRDSLDQLLKDFPEVFEGFSEMVWTIVKDLWNNYGNAVGYVMENL
ncbi:hypothetical protein NE237_012234 [Protea cynaroides]|uniref:Uncharacterized protein n=1 Tax=Protea cynaroides TaxID=273540 RepID=A0A9Q0GYR1_9MAGN|nr:hypothetical protein NE237_012234 [Protea cynaroides]